MTTNNEFMIIGFSGKIGSGKDYCAKVLKDIVEKQYNKKVLIVAFADILKVICGSIYNFTFESLHYKTSETRQKLQQVGLELREKYGKNFFANSLKLSMMKDYHKNNINLFIVTDLRFPEEYDMIKSMNGVLVRIKGEKRSKQHLLKECNDDINLYEERSKHCSETSLDNHTFDYEIQNDIT